MEGMIKMNHYLNHELNPQTMAVLPKNDENGKMVSHVLEEDAEYYVELPPTKVIDEACKFFGSSLRGRQEGTRAIADLTHKAPISIDPTSGMYFFPTSSPVHPNCTWIAHTHIQKIVAVKEAKTKVIFKNGKSIICNISIGSMENQVNRTAQFRYQLDKRIIG